MDGLKLSYGLMPAAKLAQHAPAHPESTMHGGGSEPNAYHVVLAVEEAGSGRRISDADVTLGLSGPGRPQPEVAPMEMMTIDGRPTYGRYVVLTHPGTYRLDFKVKPVGREAPLGATFEVERPG